MKKFLLFFTLLFSLLHAKSNEFSIIIDKSFDSHLFSVREDYDGELSAVGFSKKYQEPQHKSQTYTNPFDYLQNVNANYGSKTHLIKLNHKAQLSLDTTIELGQTNEATSLLKSPTNGYYIGGHTLKGSIIITSLDAFGHILFTKEFGTANNDRLKKLVALRDGTILAVATSVTTRSNNDDAYISGLGGTDIYLTKLSASGEILWSKKYGTEFDDEGIDATESDDGSLMLLSQTRNGAKSQTLLYKISENGNKLWLKEFENGDNLTPFAITKLKDRSFLISLSKEDMMHKKQIHLIKVDTQSNLLFENTVETTYSSALEDIEEFADGSLFGIGYVEDNGNVDALVMHLDTHLSMLCQDHFGDQNYDKFHAMEILKNSQIAAVGLYTPKGKQTSNMWIAKLNDDCTLAPLATESSSLYEELIATFHKEISQNMLLINKDLSIELTAENLYFNVGAYELTKEQKLFLEEFSTKLFTLLQKYQHAIDSFSINGHTSSEWSNSSFTQKYLNNEKLSLNRAFSVLSYMFTTQSQERQLFLKKIFEGIGQSDRKRVLDQEQEDKEKSRRVSFSITLK